MKRVTMFLLAVVALASCRGHEASVTGSYGEAVLAGEVVMADASSPVGIEVTAGGMVTTLGESGRFVFAGVRDNTTLHFHRSTDGINATMSVTPSSNLVIELSSQGARGRRRGATPTGKSELEGVIREASPTKIVVFTSHQDEATIAIDSATVIRKGNTTLAAADLKAGDRVHVKAALKDDVLTALEVVLQNPGDDDDDDGAGHATMTANGAVTAVSGTTLTVNSPPKGEVTVQTDANTIIKRQGDRVTVADIKPGDEVNAMGTRVDDHTLLARQIEVRGKSKRP